MTRWPRRAPDRPSTPLLRARALGGGGLGAGRGLGAELIPDVGPPAATVIVIYPGASADEVTNSVIKPIETALDAITDIDVLDVTATASESFAAITLQAEYGTKQDDIRSEIEDQLATVDLPEDANDPEIILFSFADIPAIQGSISGDIDEADLQQLVQNDLVPELEAIAGVSRVDLALLLGIDRARDTLLDNSLHFASGLPANNALLWGARGMGKSCVAGCEDIKVSESEKTFRTNGTVVRENDWVTIDGSTGRGILGKAPLIEPTISGEFGVFMGWADKLGPPKIRHPAPPPSRGLSP